MSYPRQSAENAPLLGVPTQPAPYPGPLSPSLYNDPNTSRKPLDEREAQRKHTARRAIAACCLVVVFIIALAIFLGIWESGWTDSDPRAVASAVLSRSPIIDGHIDLPELARVVYGNNISAFDLHKPMPGHVDIPRLREGRVGGFFWSVYVDCKPENENFTKPSYRVRDTLEQIDVAHLLIDAYPDTFRLATSSSDVRSAIRSKKIASLIGVEGAHQLGNSLAVLRQYYALGARYLTLTHSCNNAFADSAGILSSPPPVHGGLSTLGKSLVYELNRLGMFVDLSHVSDDTAKQALALSAARGAPVIWSHSSARAVHNVPRNVPDNILELLTTEDDAMARWRGQTDGVVMVNFAPIFVASEGKATLEKVADHVDHIAKVAGKEHVGIGSDFDGIDSVPTGLEDVSKYPDLIAELYARGWSRRELAGLAGGNLLRVMERAERVAHQMQKDGAKPSMDIYDKRTDIPHP
uniref:Dipeptidase n=1 Tax=Inonotus obliquus TaxID=167356 RepID=A0A345BJX5_9AGAM|nr:dipeptidase [Inonotus obliquus]